jgi:ADP-ribosylglycohydrolase
VPALRLPWRSSPPGVTTDGTAMARNLARSLAANGGLDPADLVARHVAWLATEPPGIDNQIRRVLSRVAVGQADAARAEWEERGPEVSAGNGSVVYSAPLGVAYANRPEELHEAAPALSAVTHWDDRCATAVTAVTLATAALVREEGAEAAVSGALIAVEDRPGGEELEFLVDAVGETRAVDGPDRGFCLFTAAVALQAALRARPFEEAMLGVVALGGDTSGNAAVAGALLGAMDAAPALPAEWLQRLADREAIEAEGHALSALAEMEA